MNSIGALEIAALVFIGLALLGPKELYRIARKLGEWTGMARRMSQEFMRELTREADMEDLRKEWTKTQEDIRSFGENVMSAPVSAGHEYTKENPPPEPFRDTVEDMGSPTAIETEAEPVTAAEDLEINAEAEPTEESERKRREAESLAPDPNGPMWMD